MDYCFRWNLVWTFLHKRDFVVPECAKKTQQKQFVQGRVHRFYKPQIVELLNSFLFYIFS